jgi:transcriptional regulator with XRE-family HTH domain
MYGAFLRKVRETRGLTQAEVARMAGIAQPNLSAYERDRRMPTIDVFNRILATCGYELAADGGSTVVHCPLPAALVPADEWPAAVAGDPVDEAPVVARDASPAERGQALAELLALADATR